MDLTTITNYERASGNEVGSIQNILVCVLLEIQHQQTTANAGPSTILRQFLDHSDVGSPTSVRNYF